MDAIDAAQEAGEDEIKIAQHFSVTKVSLRKHAAHKALAANPPSTPQSPYNSPSPQPETPSNVIPIRRCPICTHEKRTAIEVDLVAGGTWSSIGRHHLVDPKDVRRHAQDCLRGAFKRTGEESDPKAARDRCLALVTKIEDLIDEVVLDKEASYSDKAKLLGAGQRLIESLGRFTGELTQTIDESRIVASPAWKRIEAAISKALTPFPEASAAVAAALAELEAA